MTKKRAVIGKLLLIGILSLTLLCSGALANENKPAPAASAPSLCVPAASEGEADMAARLLALLESRDDDPVPPDTRQRLEGMRKETQDIGGQRFGLGRDAVHIQQILQEILRTSEEDALAEAETPTESEMSAEGCSHIWCDWEEDERLIGFTLEADQDCQFTHIDWSRCCLECALIQCKSETYYEGHVWLGVAADTVDAADTADVTDAAYMQCDVCGVQKQIQ